MTHGRVSIHRRGFPALAALLLLAGGLAAQPAEDAPLVPDSFTLHEAVDRALDAPWMTDAERAELRVFHGVGSRRDLLTPRARAIDALNAWRFDDPVFSDPAVAIELRAEARLGAGELPEAIELLDGAPSIAAGRIRAEAHESLGEYAEARAAIRPVVARLLSRQLDSAGELTDGVRALAIRARLDGQPARDYQTMMTLLARAHQELDRLYWPARFAEAELLVEKHNDREGVAALHETLALNPRSTAAWYELGRVALSGFDFDGAARAAAAIRRVNAGHPLAELLDAEERLISNDPEGAMEYIEPVVVRWPKLRAARALGVAARAMLFDDRGVEEALAGYQALSPRSAAAHYEAGRFLSMFRQYDAAAAMLGEAIRRQPAWPAPRLELGLMEMQTGRDDTALSVLREVVALDPFNKRSANSLFLLEELADYAELETEHFIIRYRPGVDEVLVDLMPGPLERLHETVATRFGWVPREKTIIELMPDHKRFGVRITGMPHIHTFAACTGPIIAFEAPREGAAALHRGPFDWERVIQHEYTHTVTLEQTRNRIPHWLTEAAAVSMELAPRDYGDCRLLASACRNGTLFDLDEIKWGFVRPKRRGDRGKAYAQGHWMVEFMNERFGTDALVGLLQRYFDGEREESAIPNALGVSRREFFDAFLVWAGAQVKAWGLAPEPSLAELTDELRWSDPKLAEVMTVSRQARLDAIVKALVDRVGAPAPPNDRPLTAQQWPDLVRPPVEINDDQLVAWRREYPDQPDLLREEIRRRIDARGEAYEGLIPKLERLAELRPVDTYPHRKLAQIHLASDVPSRAIPHLEALDAREQKSSVYAHRLATLYREAGDLDRALEKVTRSVSITPYEAERRELAAAIAIEAGRLDLARLHVRALTLLEPDRPQHERRLKRLDELMK